MPEPTSTEVPASDLNGQDLILADPDRPGTRVHWQVTGRADHTGDRVVIADYELLDGTVGRHEFDDRTQMVTVRTPRYQVAAKPMAVAA
jgi:hypothetical protein